ncbi:MAG TPA: endopeptidase La [Acidimicrobiia bacterium]|jgi:ATP-dependent Lon protease
MPENPASEATSADERLTLPLLPLTSGVVLPQMVVTLALETDEARAAGEAATSGDGLLLLVPRVDGRYARVGTVARVESTGELPNGLHALVLRGVSRAVVGVGVAGTGPGVWVQADVARDPEDPGDRARELAKEYRAVVAAIAERMRGARLQDALAGVSEPGALADTAGWWPDLTLDRKVELLETIDVEQRLTLAVTWARDALAELELTEKIRTEVSDGMEKQQREFLLRRQLDAIRKELGEGDDDVVAEYRARLDDRDVPDAVRDAIVRELDRLERTGEQNPEQGWIRTWLDTILDVPWGTRSEETLDVHAARAVLDADHSGLDDVKDRIVEFLAVRRLRRERGFDAPDASGGTRRRGSGAILALVGPPGVGKTSLGESVARALGREFARVSLGGVRDEAELRGHRRTYVGARPGRIVRALTEAGTMNPVILLDEVDKLGADWRGDPSSALLEVLDPAQNHTFRDHYLETDLDLSDVLFLATANVADTIPGPLLDRLEVIRLDGYTEDEKVAIARDHLLPRQLSENGLHAGDVALDDAAIRVVVTEYTREAGVRNLERELGKLLRKIAARLAADGVSLPVVVDDAAIRDALGRAKVHPETLARTGAPGVAAGLAVTGTGGDVLVIEATSLDTSDDHANDAGALTLTGQLGDVMKESAHIARSYVRSHAEELGVDAATARGAVHLHVPAGAVPKDGPSAGITMTTALASLLTGRAVRPEIGMTGEVTLQGRVLPIGGVKQKVLAAQRAGLTTVILPAQNEPDLDDLPQSVRDEMTFHLVDDVAEVLELALEAPMERTDAKVAA